MTVVTEQENALSYALSIIEQGQLADGKSLLGLLNENSAHFNGCSSSEAERLRAFLMVRVAKHCGSQQLLEIAYEALETGQSAYVLAAAARSIREAGLSSPEIPSLLWQAIGRTKARDEFVDFDHFPPQRSTENTALAELVRTLVISGQEAEGFVQRLKDWVHSGGRCNAVVLEALEATQTQNSCCGSKTTSVVEDAIEELSGSILAIRNIELSDQDGNCLSLGEAVLGHPSLISFFYTRCMNPAKCSRTISRMAKLKRRLEDVGHPEIAVLGLTYDPAYDTPDRLRKYGTDRGLPFGKRCRLLRTTGSFAPVSECFRLNVGYGDSTVNMHQVEWAVTDSVGKFVASGARRYWDDDELVSFLREVTHNDHQTAEDM